eukprot:195498-Pleurochrysis_carterae.AAC.1
MDIERQESKREVEKFVHGLRNGEIVGGPARERRMRHATRDGKRPSFWTYLKENGCRGCQKQEEEESIHRAVISGGCEGIVGRNKNNIYRTEMKRVLGKCKKIMSDISNSEGVEQMAKALRAFKRPRRQMDTRLKEEEESALKQLISGIIPEWREANNKKKRGVVALFRLWTGGMMNWARIQMKTWIATKNEHKANVQRRWDSRGKLHRAFHSWKKRVGHDEYEAQAGGGKKEDREGGKERYRTYGTKHWLFVSTKCKVG